MCITHTWIVLCESILPCKCSLKGRGPKTEALQNKKPAFKREDGKKMCPGKDSPPDRSHSGREPSNPCERKYSFNQRLPAAAFKYFSLTLAVAQSG